MNEQQSQIDTLVTEVGDIKTTLTATQADVTTLATGITGLESTIATLQQQVADLQAAAPGLDLSAITSTIADLFTQAGAVRASADAAVAKLPAEVPPVV